MISILLSSGGINPPLDGITPVFQAVGADPSAGGGLDLPPGSIARFGTDYYWKTGLDPTNWSVNPFSSGGGGSTNVTGSDGIHVTGTTTKNVTNDLVTGDAVAQISAHATGLAEMTGDAGTRVVANSGHAILGTLAGNILLDSASLLIATIAGNTSWTANDYLFVANGRFTIAGAGADDIILDSRRDVGILSDADINLTADGVMALVSDLGASMTSTNGSLSLTANTGQITITPGSGGLSVLSPNGPVVFQSGADFFVDLSAGADFRISFGAGSKFAVFGGAGDVQTAAIVDATGGTVQDAEARTAINALLAAMRLYGFVHT